MRTAFGAVLPVLMPSFRAHPRKMLGAALLLVAGYLATPGIALLLREITDAAVGGASGVVVWLAVATAVVLVVELLMGHFAHLLYYEAGESQEAALRERLARITNGVPAIAHFDDEKFADTLSVVRRDLSDTRAALEAALQLCGLVLQALVTMVLLGMLVPWLALLPVAAVLPVLASRRADAIFDGAKVASAADERRAMHLLTYATSADTVRELRLNGAEDEIVRLYRASRASANRLANSAQLRAAVTRALGQLFFALCYGTAIVLVVSAALQGRAGVADLVLVVVLAVQVSAQVAAVLSLLSTVQSAGRTLSRLADLERIATGEQRRPATSPAPRALSRGITLEGVGFRYPGAGEKRLDDVSLTLPAGSTVALVGENGAGKSTLVKLLCGMYQPTSGRILADDTDLSDIPAPEWSAGVAPLFQDFARLELLLRENVGAGALAHLDDDHLLREAVRSAGAGQLLDLVPGGLDGLLGHGYGDGAELSGGQWQKVGLARALVRRGPLLLVLDEPASALDATAESALFARFHELARSGAKARGAVTLFVSHRFSTVRTADLIVVLDGGRVVEAGTHAELVDSGGTYGELFRLQARAYQ
ncbi:ABC transporter ATP-binding protein [Lentzea sp. NPDC102401]|uniref:ABC transporter ATP-binding protein n=1 Tax=Lentzea sp. NPDC102401 TaxID=3364128 RepID=UPI0037F3D6B3